MKTPLLQFTSKGIYCAQAGVYLDPWRPVDHAIISHGHADHSRYGHQKYITHHYNLPIIKKRLGAINASSVGWGERFSVNGVDFELHPAGHIVGSSQILVSYKGERWVFTGDYKAHYDGISDAFVPQKCHAIITECTFGIPAFKWPDPKEIHDEINRWWLENQQNGLNSVVFAYSLGKAQRILKHLNPEIGKIFVHPAVGAMNDIIAEFKTLQPYTILTKEVKKEDIQGALIITPAAVQNGSWLKKCQPYTDASASGWMAIRGNKRRRSIDRGFVISDHCDWDELLQSIEATGAEKVICTHGYTDIFAKYLSEQGYDARTEKTQFEETDNE